MAILSIIYENIPGAVVNEIGNWDLLNLPNPGMPIVHNFFDKPFGVLKLISNEK